MLPTLIMAPDLWPESSNSYGRLDIPGEQRWNHPRQPADEDVRGGLRRSDQTNLKGVFNCVKHVSRQMLKQKSGPRLSTFLPYPACWATRGPGQLLRGQGQGDRTD